MQFPWRHLVLLVCWWPGFCLAAESDASSSALSPAPDCAPVFNLLEELGIPNVREAEYVNHNQSAQPPMTGNAWKLPAASNQVPQVILPNLSRQAFVRGNELEAPSVARGLAGLFGRRKKKPVGKRTADLAADLDLMLQWYEGVESVRTNLIRKSYEEMGYGELSAAELKSYLRQGSKPNYILPSDQMLIWAAFAHQSGLTNRANRLAARILQEQNIEALSGNVSDLLIQSRYRQLYRDFLKSRDWEAYESDLQNLVQSFSSGRLRPACQYLLTLVAQKNAGGAEGVPLRQEKLPESWQLTSAQVQLARDLESSVSAHELREFSGMPNWLLFPELKQWKSMPEPVQQLIRGGSTNLPVLVAMSSDPALCVLSQREAQRNRLPHGLSERLQIQSYEYDYDDGYNDYGGRRIRHAGSQIETLYRSLQRPLSRAELASHLLQPIYIGRRGGGLESDQYLEALLEWASELIPLSSVQRFDHYLERAVEENGNVQLVQQIFRHGLEAKKAKAREAVLHATRPEHFYSLMAELAPKASNEVDRTFVSEFVNEQMSLLDEGHYQYRSLKQIQTMLSMKSPDELLQQVAAGEKKVQDIRNIVFQVYASKPLVGWQKLVKTAAQMDDDAEIMQIFTLARQLPHYAQGEMTMAQRLDSFKVAQPALKQLTEDREQAGGYVYNGAIYLAAGLLLPTAEFESIPKSDLLTREIETWLNQAAQAAGTNEIPEPSFLQPPETDIDAEARLKTLAEAEVAARPGMIDAWDLQTWLALWEWQNENRDDKSLDEILAPLANRVISVDPDLKALNFPVEVGDILTTNRLVKVKNWVIENHATGPDGVMLQRGGFAEGIRVTLSLWEGTYDGMLMVSCKQGQLGAWNLSDGEFAPNYIAREFRSESHWKALEKALTTHTIDANPFWFQAKPKKE